MIFPAYVLLFSYFELPRNGNAVIFRLRDRIFGPRTRSAHKQTGDEGVGGDDAKIQAGRQNFFTTWAALAETYR